MNLMHIKLKNGTDLIGYVTEENKASVTIKDPVQFGFDVDNGIYGIDWMLLTDDSDVTVTMSDVFFVKKGSTKAIEFYNQFIGNYSSKKDDSYNTELETIFTALIESKNSSKH